MKSKQQTINHLSFLIQKEVGFFNGWRVSEEAEKEACQDAAKKIYRYLDKKFGPFDYSEISYARPRPKVKIKPNIVDPISLP